MQIDPGTIADLRKTIQELERWIKIAEAALQYGIESIDLPATRARLAQLRSAERWLGFVENADSN